MSKFTLFLMAFASFIITACFPNLVIFVIGFFVGRIIHKTVRNLFREAARTATRTNVRRVR